MSLIQQKRILQITDMLNIIRMCKTLQNVTYLLALNLVASPFGASEYNKEL